MKLSKVTPPKATENKPVGVNPFPIKLWDEFCYKAKHVRRITNAIALKEAVEDWLKKEDK